MEFPTSLIHSAVTALFLAFFTGSASGAVTVAPFEPRQETLRIAVVGDVGRGSATVASALANVGRIDAILLLGDNIYPCGVKSYDDPRWGILEPISHLAIPMYAVLGNHEYCGKASAEVGAPLPNWIMPAKQYAIHAGLADFAMLDTTPFAEGHHGDADEVVREVFATSKAPWRIAVGHHVIFSSGFHGIWPRAEIKRMRTLFPTLEEAHVDLYVCGHDHHEELIRGKPAIVISGAGSDPVPMVRVVDATVWPRQTHWREPIGFAVLDITSERIAIRFYGANGKPLSGAFALDHSGKITPEQAAR